MNHQERCDHYEALIMDELARVQKQVDAGCKAEAFDLRGRLYEMALALSPDARKGDLEMMGKWFHRNHYSLEGKKVVDIAAGTGYLTKYLVQATGTTVYAIDPSRVQLEQLLRESCHLGPVWPVVGSPDQEKIFDQIPEGSVDLVTSFGGVHHVRDHEALFTNVARLLKKGGRFVVGDVGGNSGLQRHFDEVVTPKCLTEHEGNWLSKDRLHELCSGLPLQIRRVRKNVPLTWVFDSIREMVLFFRGLHAYPQAEEEILKDLADPKMLGWSLKDGQVHLSWPMLFFEIVKL